MERAFGGRSGAAILSSVRARDLTSVGGGAGVYAAVIWLLDRNTVGALLDLARRLLRRSRPAPVAEV